MRYGKFILTSFTEYYNIVRDIDKIDNNLKYIYGERMRECYILS